MFSRILVALDGSWLAECAVEPAFEIARKFVSEVILLRVIMVTGNSALPADTGALYLDPKSVSTGFDRAEAEEYLRVIEAHFRSFGLTIHIEVATGEPAKAIKAIAEEQKVDLIVMSTHGRSGIMRLLYGSVAEAVLRGAHTPLLLIPLKGHLARPSWQPRRATTGSGTPFHSASRPEAGAPSGRAGAGPAAW